MNSESSFTELVEVMARLRAPNGCPWDREQTHATLKPYLIEETYEALEAIDIGDDDELCKELGDVLLQVVFHAQIATEENRFGIDSERAQYWLSVGAQPTDRVRKLMKKAEVPGV